VHLDIQVGEHANDYKQIAAKEKLTELQLRVRQLLDQVEQITKEQNYQRVCYCVGFFHYMFLLTCTRNLFASLF
jgi:hypothetical protein